MSIHHAVSKKAAKHNITLAEDVENKGYVATHADLKEPIIGPNPTDVLDVAMKALGYKTRAPRGSRPLMAEDAPALTKKKAKKVKGKKEKAVKAGVSSNKSVVRKPYKDIYKTKGSGQGNGDRLDVAIKDALDGDDGALPKIARLNNIPYVWNVLNKGLQRMNLSNVLRARVRRGETVDIMGKKIASL